jgi:N-acetylmuramoyl-L-alanine amidase
VARRRRVIPRIAALVAVAAALAFAGLALAPSALAETPSFPDVVASSPAFEAITFLSSANIISGYQDGTFGPGDTLKRGQATKMLVLWQELPMVSGEPSFPDLDDVYRDYVQTATAQGWISGFPDGRFKPYSTLSRQQMAIIMVRAMGWQEMADGLSTDDVESVLSAFVDSDMISQVARPYVAVAVSKGLFGGDVDGNLKPREGITRAQFCMVVFRAELSVRSVIQEVRSSTDWPDRTRVVLDLSKAPDSVSASASADGILTVDYTGGVIADKLEKPIEGSAEIQGVNALQLSYEPRTVRILVDLGRYNGFRVMSLAPSDGKGYRIAIDVFRRAAGPEGDGPPLICVDPGHGGEATGAIGVTGTKEKDINLSISLYLRDALLASGMRVMMTRDTDVAVDLHVRAAMANEAKANLFVCVHSNAAGDADSNGTETFYWGDSTAFAPDGKALAECIQRHLVAAIGSFDRGAKTHWNDLVVLAETEMTAALAEVGFLTNAAEEAKLVTAAYQQAAAKGITDGILEYLHWSTTVYSSES